MIPLISIVIPVYNGANYLRDAIDSALSQTYNNAEVLVVNDGSTDQGETEAICLSYGDRIRYFGKANGGVSTALNLGIREMRGEYFTWLAHDDYYYANKLEGQMRALDGLSSKTSIVHGNYDLLSVSFGGVSHMRQEAPYSTDQLTNALFPILLGTAHACTPLIHKSHFDRVGLFNENLPLTQDYEFLFRLFRGQRTVFLPEPLLCSRLHAQSGKMTDNRFDLACANLFRHFLQSLSIDEIRGMFHSPKALYYRLACMTRSRIYVPDIAAIIKDALALPAEISAHGRGRLLARLRRCSDGRDLKICIFGSGYQGKILKYELAGRDIHAGCFCDNDKNKHGTTIAGLPCVPISEIERDKQSLLVIIATQVSDVIHDQLKRVGFPYVTTKESIENMLLECPPENMEAVLKG